MSRIRSATFVFGLLLAPSLAVAQKEPPRTKELKDAEKFLASAMIAPDSAERKSRLERALNPLQAAISKNPDNGLVWFTAGQVYAGLYDFVRADSAFDKAEQLHAPLAEEVRSQRAAAWLQVAGSGEALMNAQKYEEAIAQFELAEVIFPDRPESKLNLGVLYANATNYPKSEAAYRSVLDLAAPPVSADDSVARIRFREIATIRLAQLADHRGVTAFEARRFDEAIAAFNEARKLNPHARDHAFNLTQSFYAKARDIEDARQDIADKKSAEAKKLAGELEALYTQIDPLIEELRLMDPTAEDLFILPMRSYRVRGDLATDAAAKTRFTERAAEMFKLHQGREVELVGISAVNTAGGNAVVRGTLRNLKVQPDTPIKVRVTLLGLDGQTVGTEEFAITAPAADLTTPFEVTTKASGEVAAWKYVILK
jgi:tetratricopeptide (TPR) repeat protein